MALTATGLEKLLSRLDDDAEKYEALRLKLCRFFVWRGCSNSRADELADEAFNRIAAKMEGEVGYLEIGKDVSSVRLTLQIPAENKAKKFAVSLNGAKISSNVNL